MIKLHEESKNYLELNFNTKRVKDGIKCENAYGGSEWLKLFDDGTACFSKDCIEDVINFESHQDCLDFIMIK